MTDYAAGITHRKRISGVRHWRWQRFSAVAMLFLMIYFVVSLASIGGMDHSAAMTFASHPFNAVALVAIILVGLVHGTMGLEVVIEDYVSAAGGRHLVILLVRTAMAAVALASIWAIIRIVG